MPQKRTKEKDIVVSSGATAPARARRKPSSTASRSKNTAPVAQEAAPAEATAVLEITTIDQVSEPTHEEIALLAYAIAEARGFHGGSPEEDWLRAEQELRSRATVGA